VFPVKYELGFYIPEEAFFIVTSVKTSNLIYETGYQHQWSLLDAFPTSKSVVYQDRGSYCTL
jgi:hypothetical protein